MAEAGRNATSSPPSQTSPSALAAAVAVAVAQEEPRPWGALPERVLVRASGFLPCGVDRVHMACVNRRWHAAVTGSGQPDPPELPDLPPQLPWVIFPNTEAPTFYSALGRNYHRLGRLPPDVRRARFCGSANGGWLVVALNSRHAHAYALYNLYSSQRVLLPPEFINSRGAVFPLVVRAATISNPPYQNEFMVAAIVLVADRSTAAFWTMDRDRWFSGGRLDVAPQDLIYYGGGFFFITADERVATFWPLQNPAGEVIVGRLDYDMQQRGDYDDDVGFVQGNGQMRRYLVQSRGRLHMVVRYIYHDTGTEMIRVFRFNVTAPLANAQVPSAAWEHLGDELDGRMLFLGPGCSRSFEVAQYDGFQDQESMIFFLDESFDSVPSADGRRLYSFTDMGRYSMEEMTSVPWPPGDRPTTSDNAPPTWLLH